VIGPIPHSSPTTTTVPPWPQPGYTAPEPGPTVFPHKCPVCEGLGITATVSYPPREPVRVVVFGEPVSDVRDCLACNGAGIVWG
jgi:hypothetical protein